MSRSATFPFSALGAAAAIWPWVVACSGPVAPTAGPCDIASSTGPWTVAYSAVPPPLIESRAHDIAGGFVVGSGRFADGAEANFLLTPTREVIRLAPGPGDDATEAFRVNRHGTVLGHSYQSSGQRANGTVIWHFRGPPEAAPAPGITPIDINDEGVVVGSAVFGGQIHAARWRPGLPIEDISSHLPPPELETAAAINNHGAIVGFGSTGSAGGENPFLWTEQAGFERLGPSPGNPQWTHAEAINDCGVVAGESLYQPSGFLRPWRWERRSGFTLLPVPAGAGSVFVAGIDSTGVVFGNVGIGDVVHGFTTHPYAWQANGYATLPENGLETYIWGVDQCGSVAAEATSVGNGGTLFAPIFLWSAPCGH